MTKKLLYSFNQQAKFQQYLFAGISFMVMLFLAAAVVYILFPSGKKSFTTKPHVMEAVGDSLHKEQLWKEKLSQDTESMRQEMGELLESIHQNQAQIESKNELQGQLFEDKLHDLQKQILTQSNNLDSPGEQPYNSLRAEFNEEPDTIQHISLRLSSESPRKKKLKKTVDTTIPAGSFAKSILLSGLDASTSLSSSSDPRPVLLRLVDMGQLPRSFQSDVKDCHCIASAYGDLSSERVYMRLETLTCIERLTGEIIETDVAGYIAGSDGRVGVRGVVVSKDGPYLMRGLYSGVLSGMSDMANPEHQQQLTVSGGNTLQTNPLSPEKLFLSGMGRGASKALDRVAEYNINRAEQLQPVIQIPAGQEVDIVFTKGVFMGDSTLKQEISKVRDQARDEIAENASWDELNNGAHVKGDF